MPDKLVPIGPGTRVRLKFALAAQNESGEWETIDQTGDQGAEFTVGDGNLLPGFEAAMFGLKAGANETLEIEAEHAFGPHNEDNLQKIRRDSFSREMLLEPGLVVSFADQQDSELPGVIAEVGEEYVEVDFNHPLAGRAIRFSVEILDVVQVSNDILRVSQ